MFNDQNINLFPKGFAFIPALYFFSRKSSNNINEKSQEGINGANYISTAQGKKWRYDGIIKNSLILMGMFIFPILLLFPLFPIRLWLSQLCNSKRCCFVFFGFFFLFQIAFFLIALFIVLAFSNIAN